MPLTQDKNQKEEGEESQMHLVDIKLKASKTQTFCVYFS